jgi:outer membrane protein assembly factor BamB
VYALDAGSGQIAWTYDTQDTVKGQPVLDDDKLFIVSMDTNAYALDPTGSRKSPSGQVDFADARWRNDKLGRRLVSTPAIHGGDLIVPLLDSDIKMWALDKSTGDRKMQFPPPAATTEPAK